MKGGMVKNKHRKIGHRGSDNRCKSLSTVRCWVNHRGRKDDENSFSGRNSETQQRRGIRGRKEFSGQRKRRKRGRPRTPKTRKVIKCSVTQRKICRREIR